MAASAMPAVPPSLRSIQHYLKTASEHDARDIVVSYWCRLYALQSGLKIDKSSPEAKKLLVYLMDWLERTKSQQKDNESIAHDIPAQAYIENYALKMFLWADSQDRAGVFDKNVVKAFYTSGMLYDVLETFGELTEEVEKNRKYAKWKAAYIHNCLRNGEVPVAGPLPEEDEMSDHIGFQVPPVNPPGMPDDVEPGPSSGAVPRAQIPTMPAVQPQPALVPEERPQVPVHTASGVQITPDQVMKAQKYCKFASSALSYDDVGTAVTNLQKALTLLTTGTDS